jgi:hypothetical protein
VTNETVDRGSRERGTKQMFLQTQLVWSYFRCRLVDSMVRNEQGSVVETVIITAVFAALAIAVGIIIVAKITSKANSINLN